MLGRGENMSTGCASIMLNGPNIVSFGPKYAPRGNSGLNVPNVPPEACWLPLATSARTASLGLHGIEKVRPVSVATVHALILFDANEPNW
jgi:hypothetical protein